MSYCPSVQNSTCVWPIHTQSITVLLIFSCSSPPQGCGTLRSSDYSAGAEARAPGRLHRPQQRRLLPEWAEPQSDPGAGGQFPAAGEIHVRHHHTGKRHRERERERKKGEAGNINGWTKNIMKTMTTWSSVGGVSMFLLIWMNTDLKFSNFYETKKQFF